MAHFWDVYQSDKWIAEITASSPGEAVRAVSLEKGLDSTDGMKAIEFNPDANDQNVRFVPYGHVDLDEEFETEAE